MHTYQQGSALLSVQEAADAVAVSASAIRRWIADGSLPTERTAGGAVRIRGEDVEKLLRAKIWVTPSAAEIWAPSAG